MAVLFLGKHTMHFEKTEASYALDKMVTWK